MTKGGGGHARPGQKGKQAGQERADNGEEVYFGWVPRGKIELGGAGSVVVWTCDELRGSLAMLQTEKQGLRQNALFWATQSDVCWCPRENLMAALGISHVRGLGDQWFQWGSLCTVWPLL